MFNRSTPGLVFVLLLLGVIVLDSSAREPIKSQAPIEAKIVRARDLGIPFEGTPGKLNGITDVPGVEVGYTTLISGQAARLCGAYPLLPKRGTAGSTTSMAFTLDPKMSGMRSIPRTVAPSKRAVSAAALG